MSARALSDQLMGLLACPDCGQGVEQRSYDQLKCEACARIYPVRDGIPRLLPSDLVNLGRPTSTAAHFEMEFNLQERVVDPSSTLLHYLLLSRTGLDPALKHRDDIPEYPEALNTEAYNPNLTALSGLSVLDGGCGGGRFLPIAAEAAEHVVGLELGDHVEVAAARVKHLGNVDVVQGSVLAPPFKSEGFDLCYSLGVVHHTPDPRGAARGLGSLVRRGGCMALWVYAPTYWGGAIKGPIAKLIHQGMSRMSPANKRRMARAILLPIGRLQLHLARRAWTKMLAAPLFAVNVPRHPDRSEMLSNILDYYGAPIISTHSHEEVERWLLDAGFQNVERLPIGTACLGRDRRIGARVVRESTD